MFEYTGVDAMQRRAMSVATRLNAAAGTSLRRQGDAIMTRSKTEFVPVKTGALRDSGDVDGPEKIGTAWQVELKYGGPRAPYALVQHETPYYRHRVGQWKYLETPMLEAAGTLLAAVAADLVREVK